MNAALLAAGTLVVFVLAHRIYARWIEKRVFETDNDEPTPAHLTPDGVDFVPCNKHVLFGHHFCSVAGAAPIVGPAIAVVWGWLPALLWVVIGTAFIGAVHDFGALAISAKKGGRTMGDIAADIHTEQTHDERRGQWAGLVGNAHDGVSSLLVDKPPVEKKLILRATLPDETPSGVQAFFFNLRRDKFKDRRVRQALDLAFDYEWTNKNLFYSLYQRTDSLFEASELEASGPPSPEELAVLEPFRDQLQPFVDDLPIVVDVRTPIEFDVDHRNPYARRTANCLHAVGTVHSGFDRKRDQRFDFFRGQSRCFGHDDHTRAVEIRKNINLRLCRLPGTVSDEEDCRRDDKESLSESESNDRIQHSLAP